MALAASTPPTSRSSPEEDRDSALDAEIAQVRAEIRTLRKRKQTMTSSLLSSTNVQSRLIATNKGSPRTKPSDPNPLKLQAQTQHNQTSIHRLAIGVTSFPYTDPNPDTSDTPLLGVRFDLPSRSGTFEKAPYYIFLKRSDNDDNQGSNSRGNRPEALIPSTDEYLEIHHHTIPALVPLHEYETKYLPQPGRSERERGAEAEVADMEVDAETGNAEQDLHTLVKAVYRDLVSWNLRTETIATLAERFNLSSAGTGTNSSSLTAVQATAVDARFVRLVWENGTVCRLRLADDGYVDRAVVIGEIGEGGEIGRLKDIERSLSIGKRGEPLRVGDLAVRLEQVGRRMQRP